MIWNQALESYFKGLGLERPPTPCVPVSPCPCGVPVCSPRSSCPSSLLRPPNTQPISRHSRKVLPSKRPRWSQSAQLLSQWDSGSLGLRSTWNSCLVSSSRAASGWELGTTVQPVLVRPGRVTPSPLRGLLPLPAPGSSTGFTKLVYSATLLLSITTTTIF